MLSTSNAPYRGGKANLFDGGLRVPAIVSWPGVTTPGRVDDTPVILTDLFPTLLAAAGVAAPEQPCDGANLLPLIRGAGTRPERDLFWHFPHYTLVPDAVPSSAIRSGRYKLIEWHDRNAATLTDVLDDPGEAHDLAAELPQVVAELRGRLAAWRNSVRAQMATVNPNPDPAWKIMPTTSLFIDPVVRRWMDDP
jgi:arylsulfatase A-like enzyme